MAGVSHQTVSRVLHESPLVRRETRDRVLAAIRMLNYRPSSVAQALATGRSKTLGVVSFDTTLFGPAATMVGIERAAHEAGYSVAIASIESLDRASVETAIERLRLQSADGIVVVAPHFSVFDTLRTFASDVPIVAVGAGPEGLIPLVAVDQFTGARLATQHLLELGHRTVWHIAGPADWLDSERRIDGWRAALKKAGVQATPVLRGDWSARSGYDLGRQILEKGEATAVFVANDQMALGLLRQLQVSGRQSPRDLSIVGFDDIPEAEYFNPPLTTVRQNFQEVGHRCLHLLLGQIEKASPRSPHLTVPAELVVRESTGAPTSK
jgi:DNA-binding LacI/PurR family transcriptional regulator